MGKYLTAALLSTGKHTVTAVTRAGGSAIPEGCKTATVDYDKEETLVDALRGQQFLIITMSVMAPRDTQSRIIAAAAKAGVPWVMPNCYGADFTNKSLASENLTGPGVLGGIEDIEKGGVSSWVTMCCSFWYEFSLSLGSNGGWYGFDFKNKKVAFNDDGNTKINTSTWDQCGRAIKSLLSLKELPEDEHDTSPTVSQWRNKPLYISSFLVSQRDMLDSVHRVMGTTDKDWKIESEKSSERYKHGLERFKKGDHIGFAIALYSRTFYPNGDGNFEAKHGLANGALGLPKEDLDEATKRAVGLAESGFTGYGDNVNLDRAK